MKAHSRTLSIDAPPDVVHRYVSDAANLPQWAPAFATTVRPVGDHWMVTQGEVEFAIDVVADVVSGTADFVAHSNRDLGAFTRVIPNAGGCEYSFTRLFPDSVAAADVDAQMADVAAELETVRDSCEAG